MTGRWHNPIADDIQGTLALTIADAVEAAEMATYEFDTFAHHTASMKSGIGTIFAKARAAVAETEPGNIGLSVFDAAMRAAAGAVAESSIRFNYDKMREVVTSIPDHLIWMAARQAANDLFSKMSAKSGTAGDKRLRGRMRTAAVRAAKTRIGRGDGVLAVSAATENIRYIVDGAIRMTSDIIRTGAPVHAATAAVFGVAIQDVPPASLAGAIKEACEDLPEMARRHDDLVVGFVAALSVMIAEDAAYRRKYQTAIRGAEKICQDEAVVQITNMVAENAFEMVYTVLVAGAYATSDGAAFESGYEKALADACKLDSNQILPARMSDIPQDLEGEVPEEVFREMHQRLSGTLELLFSTEEEQDRRNRFRNALNVDYKAVVSKGFADGIIPLYEMAYRVGYEKAQDIASKAQGGPRRRK